MIKAREWYSYVQGVVGAVALETVTCTPYHYADLYADIIEEEIITKVYRRPCIENGKPIYKFYTLQDYERMKKKMGPYIWSAQMMCDPSPVEDMLFPPPQPTYKELPPDGKYKHYITIDPAATIHKHSDETAMVVVAVDERGEVYVREALHFKKTGNEIARILIQLAEKYKPEKIGIELGLQEHLRGIIELVKNHWEASTERKIDLPIEGIKIGHDSKFDRVNWTLGSFVRERKVHIHESLTDLMLQMEKFSPNYQGRDDLVDALSMARLFHIGGYYPAYQEDAHMGREI